MQITVDGYGAGPDGVHDGLDAVGVDAAGIVPHRVVAQPGGLPLGQGTGIAGADADGHVIAARAVEELGDQRAPIGRVARVAHHQARLQGPVLKQQGEGPGIVDVAADVGIQDDGDAGRHGPCSGPVWYSTPRLAQRRNGCNCGTVT